MITIGFNNKKLQGVWVAHCEIENAIIFWEDAIKNREEGEKIKITFGNRVVERCEVAYLMQEIAKMLTLNGESLKDVITVTDARYPYIEEDYTTQDVENMLERIEAYQK